MASTPQLQPSSVKPVITIPAQSPLPPSPDIGSSIPYRSSLSPSLVPNLSLDETVSRGNLASGFRGGNNKTDRQVSALTNRLRSIAKYDSFQPQALACSSDIFASGASSAGSLNSNTRFTGGIGGTNSKKDNGGSSPSSSSLGAIAGPQGLALFRLSRPSQPLVVFPHVMSSSSSLHRQSISSLSFRPTTNATSSSAILAVARGSGVLLFDASGHSPNPLQGRLVVGPFVSGGGGGSEITSVSWKPTTPSQNTVLLATTTASSLSLWDLRLPTVNGSSFRPALKFGASNQTSFGDSGQRITAPLVSVACSSCPSSEECATLDANGVVRIYDLRMTERGSSSVSAFTGSGSGGDVATTGSPVATFAAHGAGMGIFYLPSDDGAKDPSVGPTWVTFGLESPPPIGHPVVKVWRPHHRTQDNLHTSTSSFSSADDYWLHGKGDDMKFTSSPAVTTRKTANTTSFTSSKEYHVIARYERPNLTCARLCPSPMKDSFVVVGYQDRKNNDGRGWWAELLRTSKDDFIISSSDPSFELHGLEQVASFFGGEASTMVDNNQTLGSVLGKSKVGNLQAAELAISSMTDRPTLIGKSTSNSEDDQKGDAELLLCCLSDTGILTTTAIPEANPQLTAGTKTGSTYSISPRRRAVRNAFRAAFPTLSTQMRVFPESRAGSSLLDVAGLYSTGDGEYGKVNRALLQSDPDINRSLVSPVKTIRMEPEQRLFPFDMEIPVPVTSNIQNGIPNNPAAVRSSLDRSTENIETQIKKEVSQVDNIDTERVPCPRLCGASFGRGKGGLVVFRNGKVQQMWQWYQKSDIDAKSSSAFSRRELSHLSEEFKQNPETTPRNAKLGASSGPRSLKEMIDMMAAAKEAQWGEENEESAGDDALNGINPFFEDESDSNSDDSDNDDSEDGSNEDGDGAAPKGGSGMYKRYFGSNAWKNTIEQKDDRPSLSRSVTIETATSRSRASVGPASDMLEPVVTVFQALDSSPGENRSFCFAENWKLSRCEGRRTTQANDKMVVGQADSMNNAVGSLSNPLPHYRDLVPSSPSRYGIVKARSDPTLVIQIERQDNLSKVMNEPGVHGGQYSIRPAQTESMTFLKKLLVSQQKGSGSTLPALMSPPDSPGLVLSRGVSSRRLGGTHSLPVTGEAGTNSNRLGAHTVQADPLFHNEDRANLIEEVCSLCLHNAKVCKDCRDSEKEVVWTLLADSLQHQLKSTGQTFNGWGGPAGGALGSSLVSNFFAYYEGLGDFQMLASIYCVLDAIGSRGGGILPEKHGDDYDNYIRRYTELLYGWGLLNVRAEVSKHLSMKASRYLNEVILQVSDNTERDSGFGIVISCPKCASEVNRDTNFCTNCRDWALRCSICENSVREMLTLCERCGHGGHLSHIMAWFQTQSHCPSGCGCQCVFLCNANLSPADGNTMTAQN